MISWTKALALWWSFTWRFIAFGLPFIFVVGFIAYPVAQALGIPESDHQIAVVLGQLLWFPASVLALRFALLRYPELFVATAFRFTWAKTFSVWWSFLWRISVYGLLIGLLLGLFVSVFVGRPSEHPGYLLVTILVGVVPIELAALRGAVSKQTFSIGRFSNSAIVPNHTAEPGSPSRAGSP